MNADKCEFNKDDILIQNYLESLKGRIFKILPLFEENNEGVFNYINSLIYEIYGLAYVVIDLDNSYNYIILISTLESLKDDAIGLDVDYKFIKSEVFKCINIVTKLKEGMV